MGQAAKNSKKTDSELGISSRLASECEPFKESIVQNSPFSRSTVYNWLNGTTMPSAEFLAYIQNLGIDVPYILSGQQQIQISRHAEPTEDGTSEASPFLRRLKRPLTGKAPKPQNDEDTIYIPLLSAKGSMGPGSDLVTADVVMGDIPVSLLWLQMNLPRRRPQALRLVHAYGDSMRGTLDSGDFALVDTDVHTIDVDGVYVLEAHDRLFIKRVRQRMDGQYEVSSDNPSIKQTDVLDGDHQIRICGMVVYGWNGRRF